MPYYIWIIINTLVICVSAFYIWFINPHPSFIILTGQFFAQIAILLFIVNINMHFIFLVIKKAKSRKLKIMLSKFSRKMMKLHIPMGIIGTSFILLHAAIMLTQLGGVSGYFHTKMVSGYVAVLLLALTLFGGYRRQKKASGFRRKFHMIMAFIFGSIFMLHLFLPI